jgi:hypothetical protein
MVNVDRAYNQVRRELAEVGLLSEGVYLDHIELYVSEYPSRGEAGYVFESIGNWGRLGFRPGVIYLPSDMPQEPRVPGSTLIDTIRHEFAHAWYYTDPKFFREDWFCRTFGAPYSNCNPRPLTEWSRKILASRRYQVSLTRCRSERSRRRVRDDYFRRDFISDYASTCACEDFAETFMYFLKYRHSLDRFESRPLVARKLQSVERAVSRMAQRLRSGRSQGRWKVKTA